MNCPHCNTTMETLALRVIGVADFVIGERNEIAIDDGMDATVQADWSTTHHRQTCGECERSFDVQIQPRRNRFGWITFIAVERDV